ncbi:MAG TPA: hypothetical protein VGQ83_15595 [Polyangia bacterium]|jgi:hypothetical protein
MSETRDTKRPRAPDQRDSGEPGGGAGRKDEVGQSGVWPASADPARIPAHAEPRTMAAWGQGERGAAGYEDAGGSELTYRDGQILGGTTSGPSGEPTIDIHGGDRHQAPEEEEARPPDEKK